MRFSVLLAAFVAAGTTLPLALPVADAAPRHHGSEAARDLTPPHGPVAASVSVCFVPAQECDRAVADAIRSAKDSIRVQAYGFTAPMILHALADARAANVDVQAILDRSNLRDHGGSPMTGAAFTVDANIPTWIDDTVAIAHNKLIIIDDRLVIGGSYNYTASAERKNAENVTFIDSPDIAGLYLANWEARKAVSHAVRIGMARNGDGSVAGGSGTGEN
jgi:phospholipase D